MSVFTRIWKFIRNPTGYVGRDLQGNYFYEYASKTGGRSRRVMKYKGQTDTLAIAERSRQLAVQWKAWLTHTRQHPPTLQELQADVLRQERLRHNVALIEAREREERLRLAAASQPAHENEKTEQEAVSAPRRDHPASDERRDARHTATASHADAQSSMAQEQSRRNQTKYDHDPWVSPPASDEPQSWKPRAIQRGE